MFKKNIIGIDIDDKLTAKKILRILRILQVKGYYRFSSSRRGYHFKIIVRDHTKKENLIIRYMFSDCYGRWMLDTRRLKHGIREFDVLFEIKNNKLSGKWKKI